MPTIRVAAQGMHTYAHVRPARIYWKMGCASKFLTHAYPGRTAGFQRTVFVVFADKDSWEAPQFGNVVGFEDLALVRGTVTVEADRDSSVVKVLVGQCEAGTKRDLGTDNAIASVEVFAVHVHGTALE